MYIGFIPFLKIKLEIFTLFYYSILFMSFDHK
jgi:hypothetical protein